eukprot:scaffold107533_cov63-Phaeocystis_antarctica.AAC.2
MQEGLYIQLWAEHLPALGPSKHSYCVTQTGHRALIGSPRLFHEREALVGHAFWRSAVVVPLDLGREIPSRTPCARARGKVAGGGAGPAHNCAVRIRFGSRVLRDALAQQTPLVVGQVLKA